ncbi:MAG: hypothetical protein ACR2N3_07890 [Pyrinomonadaceae bacterium]
MRNFAFLVLILISPIFALAQGDAPQKPLTQAEYVKLLYALDKNPAMRDEVVETVRKRGIAFQITDGLRSLTSVKSHGDAELRRTLEESARRQSNPTVYNLPSAKESAEVLNKAREATLAAVDEMPDFVVKQQIQRGASYAGTNNFRNLDRLVVAVSYRAEGSEEYKILSVNGVLQPAPTVKNTYEDVGGTSSTGEFVTVLATIFKPESETKFEPLDTDVIRGRRAIVYTFETAKDKAKQIISTSGSLTNSTITGIKGKLWIDRENFRVLRIESQATEIPVDFPVTAASRDIDYDWVTIADEKYLLPSYSEVRLTSRENRDSFETRNQIRFKEYQKYGSEVKVLDDDETPIQPAPEENKKP